MTYTIGDLINEEIKKNPPSRSAKLRFAIKDKNILNFEKESLEKYNYLLEKECGNYIIDDNDGGEWVCRTLNEVEEILTK